MPTIRAIDCGHYIPRGWYKRPRRRLSVQSPCEHTRGFIRSLKGVAHKLPVEPAYRPVKQYGYRVLRRSAKPLEVIEQQFHEQADKWRRETEHLSSPAQIMMHPSYHAILGMAKGREQEVIRLMLCDLRDNRAPWFWALSYLTKENPIQQSDAGNLDKMIKAWVNWGTARGIL